MKKFLLFTVCFSLINIPHNAISQTTMCLSAYGCNESLYGEIDRDLLIDLYIINMESNFQQYPPGPERRACEEGCHEAGDVVAEECRAHSNAQTQRICLSRVMDAVSKCIRNCA